MVRLVRAVTLLSCFLFAANSFATNYYVDYTNGSDTNSGTSKSAPWKRAPGMYTCANNCSSARINPGDSIILKGCVTWPNAVFPWQPQYSGSNGNPIYIGVDQTWWDNTVSGCSTTWNRPILNPQGQTTDPGNTGLENVINSTQVSYVTWDNFEITQWYTYPDTYQGSHEAHVFFVSSGGHGASYITIQNMYVHGWINPFLSIGTGNISNGSCTITNFVPYKYSPSPSSSWVNSPSGVSVQALPQGMGGIPEGNNSPMITGITGSNPYTITFTNSSGCATQNVNGAVIQIGRDAGIIVAGNSAGDTGTVIQDNVFDGSDTAEVQFNPYGDCGATEGNNNACLASVEAGRQGPQIWLNNVIRYVDNGFIGSSSVVAGNLIEYLRQGIDPTGHTNVWEDQPCLGSLCLYYGNVVRHMNSVNSNIPGGFFNVGEPWAPAPTAGNTSYMFNNVLYDMTQNVVVELNTDCNGCGAGTFYMFNNTIEGGPDANPAYGIFTCAVTSCKTQNNHAITSFSSPFGNCGSGCTLTTNLTETLNTACNNNGYCSGQNYSFSPTSGNSPTVGAGTNVQSLCTTLSGLNAAAGAACQSDTPYAVTYNATNHTVVIPDRTANTRPPTGAWDVGGYEFSTSQNNPPNPPTGLTAVVN